MASILKVNEIQHTGGTSALTVDSSGRVFTPARPSFNAGLASQISITATTVKMNAVTTYYSVGNITTNVQVGSGYDNTNYKYVVPVTGIYVLGAQVNVQVNNTAARYLSALIHVDGSEVENLKWVGSVNDGGSYPDYDGVSGSTIAYLTSGMELELKAYCTETVTALTNTTFFYGYLLG